MEEILLKRLCREGYITQVELQRALEYLRKKQKIEKVEMVSKKYTADLETMQIISEETLAIK